MVNTNSVWVKAHGGDRNSPELVAPDEGTPYMSPRLLQGPSSVTKC